MGDLDLVRAGDREARERWAGAWWPRVYRMALAMTGREADAEDLAQETLMAGLSTADRFRGDCSEGAWLYAILLRKRISQHRRRPAALPAAPEARASAAEEAAALLDGLPPPQRIVAALFYVEDLSVEEIARALGIPRATVRWRLFRARQKLRRRLRPTAPKSVCEETV